MCYLRLLKVKKTSGQTVFLENGLKAFYDQKIGKIKKGDRVVVFGNLIIQKSNEREKS